MSINSQPQVTDEQSHLHHYHQPRPIHSYNMHPYCPTLPINQVTDITQLPWEQVTSHSPNFGEFWYSTGLASMSRVHRPTPLYINKPSVIKHTSNVKKASSTITIVPSKRQESRAENEYQEEQNKAGNPIELIDQLSVRTTPEKEESSVASGITTVSIKEEKVDSPCTPSSSCNQDDHQPAIFEETRPEERRNEYKHLLPWMPYSSSFLLNYGTESAFHTPAKPSASAYPMHYNQESESAFQKPSSSMYSLQYEADKESAFQKLPKSSSSNKCFVPTSEHDDAEQSTSGLSYGSKAGSSGITPSTSTKPKTSKHVCDECGRSFTRSSTLVTHKRIHTGEKPFECEICGRAFRQPGNLSRHRLTHTTSKPYVCPHCNKAFNRASNLHTHMRTHSDYKPYECEFCDKRFHQKVDMKIHRFTHTGEKPHRCPKCGRGFKQLTHLTYHLRTHSDVRMYHCEFCGKGFNQKGNLQAHRYRHTGERPFKCDVCGKGFTLASTRNTHLRTHATRKPFQCQYCDKSFYQKNALKTHYIASHPYTDGVLIL